MKKKKTDKKKKTTPLTARDDEVLRKISFWQAFFPRDLSGIGQTVLFFFLNILFLINFSRGHVAACEGCSSHCHGYCIPTNLSWWDRELLLYWLILLLLTPPPSCLNPPSTPKCPEVWVQQCWEGKIHTSPFNAWWHWTKASPLSLEMITCDLFLPSHLYELTQRLIPCLCFFL